MEPLREDEASIFEVVVDPLDPRLGLAGDGRHVEPSVSVARSRCARYPALLGAVLVLSGCGGCKEEKPYVPFSIGGSASASASVAPTTSVTPEATGTFQVVSGVAPTGDPRSFPLGTSSVRARAGRVFRRGLAFDGDADGATDLFAWTEAGDSSKGELVYFHGGAGPETAEIVLAKLPKEIDIGSCSHDVTLQRIGKGVVSVSLALTCGEAKEKEQWFAIARLDVSARPPDTAAAPPEVRLDARARAPIAVDLITDDRDKDGMEDVVLVVHEIGDVASDRISASVVLWDRPSGYAWDPAEPEASLGQLGKSLLARAVAKKPDASTRAERTLKMVRAMCSDLGGPRFTVSAGALKCQESRVIGDAVHTIAFAASNGADYARAIAGAEAVSNLKFDHGRVPQIDNLYAKKVKKVDALIERRTTVKPSSDSGVYAPLLFDNAGGLYVMSSTGVTRVDLATGEELATTDVSPWSRVLAFSAGDATVELLGVTRACPSGQVTLRATARGGSADAPLPVLASFIPLPTDKDACDKLPLDLSPLLVDNDGATFAVRGEVFRATFGDQGVVVTRELVPPVAAAASPAGAARTSDGRAAVLPVGKSLLVYKAGSAERWRGPDLQNFTRCVVESSGAHVACATDTHVAIIAPGKAPVAPGPAKKR